MCGIGGLMTQSGSDPKLSVLERMSYALAHRGGDGLGQYIEQGVGLVHRRLAIIDLETGQQPILHPSGAVLVANGEIYNYRELIKEFDKDKFVTASDCEVPLHLYERDGELYAKKLRGMYAIGIFDPNNRRLVLSRDPFGIKPLYFCQGAFGFAFASEAQSFFEAGLLTPKVRREGVMELTQLQFTVGSETIFENIFRVLPGETLVVEKGRVVRRHRLPALPVGGETQMSVEDALAQIDVGLEESVSVHQRSDVPFGMFLSGGIDSTALLLQMKKLSDRPVKAYTVGFPETSVPDEREHAGRIAAALGADHVKVDFSEDDFWDLLPAVAHVMDDPVADYAQLPTYKLAGIAAKDVKVILSGEGGDEMLAGYGRHRAIASPWRFWSREWRRRGALSGLGLLRRENRDWQKGMLSATKEASLPKRSPLQVAQATDCAAWLPHDLLLKLDRSLMAHGVEGRTPFLDPVLASLFFQFPDRLKIRGKYGKWILRKWLEIHLPLSQPFARKRGFTVPVGEWIRRKGKHLGPLVANHPTITEICRVDAVERIFQENSRRAGFAAWILLFFVLWHKSHVERQVLEGNVFDCLDVT
jgi:asparagine synthase (glutamine-hydrolysing)